MGKRSKQSNVLSAWENPLKYLLSCSQCWPSTSRNEMKSVKYIFIFSQILSTLPAAHFVRRCVEMSFIWALINSLLLVYTSLTVCCQSAHIMMFFSVTYRNVYIRLIWMGLYSESRLVCNNFFISCFSMHRKWKIFVFRNHFPHQVSKLNQLSMTNTLKTNKQTKTPEEPMLPPLPMCYNITLATVSVAKLCWEKQAAVLL